MANGNGNGGLTGEIWKEVPTWFKVAMQFGAPTLFAGWLIYLFSTSLVGDVRELKASVQQHVMSSDAMMQRFNDSRAMQDMKIDILIRIAQTQCVNAASDSFQRRDCLAAGK
jgi:hypothetical protein